MNKLQDLPIDTSLQSTLSSFIEKYGASGLEQALQLYTDMQQEYICKTKTSISKIKLCDIYYLEIQEHNITVHTQHGIYQKYGTLNNELKFLSQYGFIKCNQSCIVSLSKIRTTQTNDITLINNEKLHMSRKYAPKVLIALRCKNFSKNAK